MHARAGDRIILAAERLDLPTRSGRVTEARGPDHGPPFLVAWDDGHTGLLFPGPGAILQVRPGAEEDQPDEAAPASGHDRQWEVQVAVHGEGDDTTATAVLRADLPELSATGSAHRSERDPEDPRIGDEVAVARALRHLADRLMATAEGEVEAATGGCGRPRRS